MLYWTTLRDRLVRQLSVCPGAVQHRPTNFHRPQTGSIASERVGGEQTQVGRLALDDVQLAVLPSAQAQITRLLELTHVDAA